MKLKRLIACVLAVCLLLGGVPVAFAAGDPTVSITTGKAKVGETVTLTVNITNNPGLVAWMIYLYFDTSVFTVDPGSDISLTGGFKNGGGMLPNSIAAARKNGQYKGDAGKDGVLVLWYSGSGRNNNSEGAALTVKFHVSDDAANGTYQIGVGYSKMDTGNENGEKIALATQAGAITVSGGSSDGGGGVVEQPAEEPYTDVAGHWAEEYILDAYQMNLMIGNKGMFRPDDTLSRAEFAMVLWRIAGTPEPTRKASFTDLVNEWYMDAVAWVEESGMMVGIGNGRFDPGGMVTREQVVTVLHRMEGSPTGMESVFGSFYDEQYSDSAKVSSWAKKGLYWAIYEGIYCGQNSLRIGQQLDSRAHASRAQIAVMMVRYLNNG